MSTRSGDVLAHKTLTANDIGLTGSHQAGIHVPKSLARSGFLPPLDEHLRNPREELEMEFASDRQALVKYIYYNNRRYGGTRDEFRLTHLTQPLRQIGAYSGGLLQITRLGDVRYRMELLSEIELPLEQRSSSKPVLRLSGGWVLINI